MQCPKEKGQRDKIEGQNAITNRLKTNKGQQNNNQKIKY
jgi:hypothetical protein